MPRKSAASTADDRPPEHLAAEARVLAVVRQIPPGSVLGYGEVARRAGFPRGARLAARVLAGNVDPSLPWHRVLRADGRIAFPAGSAEHVEQQRRLTAEGVPVRNGRVAKIARRADIDPGEALDRALWRFGD